MAVVERSELPNQLSLGDNCGFTTGIAVASGGGLVYRLDDHGRRVVGDSLAHGAVGSVALAMYILYEFIFLLASTFHQSGAFAGTMTASVSVLS